MTHSNYDYVLERQAISDEIQAAGRCVDGPHVVEVEDRFPDGTVHHWSSPKCRYGNMSIVCPHWERGNLCSWVSEEELIGAFYAECAAWFEEGCPLE